MLPRSIVLLATLTVLTLGPGLAAAGEATDPLDLSELDYDRGFELATRDGRFALKLCSAIQLRYTYVAYDEQIQGNDTDYSNFYLRRARLWWKGHAYDPRLTFYFHLQLEPNRATNAHDVWIEYAFSDLLRLGAGRNKIAYGGEFLASGFGLNLVERSVMYGETDIDVGGGTSSYPGGGTAPFGLHAEADTGFATGGMTLYRSQGIQLRGRTGSTTTPTFEYHVGLWQGRRTTGLSNRDAKHLVAARVGYFPWGWVDWSAQGEGESNTRHRLGLVVSAYTQSSTKAGGFAESGHNLTLLSRWRGLSADLEWATERFDYDAFADDFERQGWRAQLGAFVVPGRLELVVRWAAIERLVDPTYRKAMDSGLGVAELRVDGELVTGLEDEISEITAGINLYLHDWHQHKLQLDVSRLRRRFAADPHAVVDGEASPIARAPDQEDYRLRALVQLKF